MGCFGVAEFGFACEIEEQRLEGFRVEGFGEEESLYLVDVFAAEVVDLAGAFDSFGEGLQAEVFAELDEGVDEGVGFG